MTQLGNERIVGVDVSKDRLDLYDWDSKCPDSIANDIDAIDRWLDGFSLPVRFAIEPTNQFHIALAERAHARGHAVYLVDPHRLSHYRCGVGQRVKADPQDAQLLARYLAREGDDLAPWKPLSQGQQRFWRLLRRRATVVRARIQLQQSLSGLKTLNSDVDALLERFKTLIKKMERALLSEARKLGWDRDLDRCQAIPGIGPLSALALTAIFHQGTYRNADAFIAFMGMDVRVRQSGRWKGKSKLTKKGDPEVRRLLFNAAMQARRNPLWEPYYLALRERGFSTTAAFVALGRKLARVAFALLQKNVEFDANLHMAG
jgi:transposase